MFYVALLRGINVGGRRKVDMRQLKETFQRCGLTDVQTYINSGNVLFRGASTPRAHLVNRLERAIQADFGFPVMVILRNAGEIKATAEALPESWMDGKGAKCDVMFLHEDVDNEAIWDQITVKPGIDDVRYIPGALLWYVPRPQVTRSGLMKLPGSPLYQKMTIRNGNTVRKLAELIRQKETAGSAV